MQINSIQHCPRCGATSVVTNPPKDAESVPVYCTPGCVDVVERLVVYEGRKLTETYYIAKGK